MTPIRPKVSFRLSASALRSALILVAAVGVVVGLSLVAIGPNTAQAAYVAILFLLSPSRSRHARVRLWAAVAAIGVAMAGYLIGPLGMPAVVAGIVAVAIVQARFRLGDVSGMSRAPVNFMVFAALSQTGAALWQVLLGSVIGAAFILLLTCALPPTTHEPEPSTRRSRTEYGVTLAVGVVAIVVVAELLQFPYVAWALLSYCMVLSVGADRRLARAGERIVGTVIGAVVATALAFAPAPAPIVAAVIATVLCVAYLRMGNYTMFVVFLTPSVLLLSGADDSAIALGVGRIEAVVAAGLLAIALTAVVAAVSGALARRRPPVAS